MAEDSVPMSHRLTLLTIRLTLIAIDENPQMPNENCQC